MALFATSYVEVERDCVMSRKRKFEDRLLEGSRYDPFTAKQPRLAPESLKGADVISNKRQANKGSKDSTNTRHPLIDLTLVDSSVCRQEGNKGYPLAKGGKPGHFNKRSSPARDLLGEGRPSKRFNLQKALRQADDYYREKRRSTELKTESRVDPLEELFGEELPDLDIVPVIPSHRHENVAKISKVLGSRNEPIVVVDESCNEKKPCDEPIVMKDQSCDGKQSEISTSFVKNSKEPVQGPLTLKQRQFVDSLFEDTPPLPLPPTPQVTRERKCLTDLMTELEKDCGTAHRESYSDRGHNSSLSSRKPDDVTIPSKVLAQRQLVNIKQKLLSSLSGIAGKETCSLAVKKSYEGSLSKRQLTPVRELSRESKSHNLASKIETKLDKIKAAKNNTSEQETGQRRSDKKNSSAVRKFGEGTSPKHITSPVRDLLVAKKKQSPVTKSEEGSLLKRSSSPVRNLTIKPKSNKILNTKLDVNKTDRGTKKEENIQSTNISAPYPGSAMRSTSDTSQAEKMICSTNFRKSFSTFKIPKKPKITDTAVDQLKTVSRLTLREVTPAWVSKKTTLSQGNGRYCPL